MILTSAKRISSDAGEGTSNAIKFASLRYERRLVMRPMRYYCPEVVLVALYML
jgi:hypothetical protein